MSTKTLTQERRHFARASWPGLLGVSLLQPTGVGPINHVNVSEGGLCLRLPAMLEVRSLVRLQLAPGGLARRWRPIECTGRVAWVTQRLDLRAMPPYLFDVGIEFVEAPHRVHQWMTQLEGKQRIAERPVSTKNKQAAAAVIKGRRFEPTLICDGSAPARWHLIVAIESVPCFSHHYPTNREALAAWEQFKRQQSRGSRSP
ncbi:MAG: PilZ domain-containing protein [Candidatus Omnitrophica bacterium]|nr:PilZ domain-containing protein [Candidatus Omnitrophota bacterium]